MTQMSQAEQRSVAALQAAIRIPTISGAPAGVFDAFHQVLRTHFPRLLACCELRYPQPDALLLRWPGAGSGDPVVLMAHQDVVPINPDDPWRFGPFEARIADGYIWGRGALDCKGPLIGLCCAAEQMIGAGLRPQRDIYFSFGCDEEVAGSAAEAAVELLAELGAKPYFVLDEGGAIALEAFPGVSRPVAVIGVTEKGTVDLQLSTTEEGGHASMPTVGGACARIAKAVLKLDRSPFPPHLPDATVQMLAALAPHAAAPSGPALRLGVKAPALLSRLLARLGPETAAMTRTTMAVTQLQGSPAPNVIASTASATVNIRVMPGQTIAQVLHRIRTVINDDRVHLQVLSGTEPSPVSPIDDDAFRLLADTVTQVFPDALAVPFVVLAATDARRFAERWPRVYRFNPLRMTRAQRVSLHNVDERIGITDFLDSIRYYQTLMEAL